MNILVQTSGPEAKACKLQLILIFNYFLNNELFNIFIIICMIFYLFHNYINFNIFTCLFIYYLFYNSLFQFILT